jgi:hypothetical protein
MKLLLEPTHQGRAPMVMSSTASSIGSDRMSASSPAAVRSSDRNGSLLLPDAVSRQLGLKLDIEAGFGEETRSRFGNRSWARERISGDLERRGFPPE